MKARPCPERYRQPLRDQPVRQIAIEFKYAERWDNAVRNLSGTPNALDQTAGCKCGLFLKRVLQKRKLGQKRNIGVWYQLGGSP